MYEEVGQVSAATITQLKGILDDSDRWEVHVSPQTNHASSVCIDKMHDVDEIVARWPAKTWLQILFIRLPAGGKLYRHADHGYGFHIPIETNDEAISLTYENGMRKEQHLEIGKIYRIDRSIEHESFNDGATDRTHLIVLLKDFDND